MSKTQVYIISGHYGSGKTNIAINLALSLKNKGSTAIFDLDTVNPYFRTADFAKEIKSLNIDVYAPYYANTNLDIPALTGEFSRIYNGSYDFAVVDVGGDDDGARVLGMYEKNIKNCKAVYHWYVVNYNRVATASISGNIELINNINRVSGIDVNGIINNTNLGSLTKKETVLNSIGKAKALSKAVKIPVVYTAVREDIPIDETANKLLKIKIYTKEYW